jgi:cytochrome P450
VWEDPDLEQRPDVLAMLGRAADEDGTVLTDDELRDHLVTLLLAGDETTATGLVWTLERLARLWNEAQNPWSRGLGRQPGLLGATLRLRSTG